MLIFNPFKFSWTNIIVRKNADFSTCFMKTYSIVRYRMKRADPVKNALFIKIAKLRSE